MAKEDEPIIEQWMLDAADDIRAAIRRAEHGDRTPFSVSTCIALHHAKGCKAPAVPVSSPARSGSYTDAVGTGGCKVTSEIPGK